MKLINWINTNQAFILVIANVLLVCVTAVYVFLTRKIARFSEMQFKTASNPIIGVRVSKMYVSKANGNYGRTLKISTDLQNIGNAPAINIQVIGEIIFGHTKINGSPTIPAHDSIRTVPYILPGEKFDTHFETDLFFGKNAVIHLFDDFRENHRLNRLRIDTDPSKEPYEGPKLRIRLFYGNNLDQLFESIFEVFIEPGLEIYEEGGKKKGREKAIPTADGEDLELGFHPYKRPIFNSSMIDRFAYNKILEEINDGQSLYKKVKGRLGTVF